MARTKPLCCWFLCGGSQEDMAQAIVLLLSGISQLLVTIMVMWYAPSFASLKLLGHVNLLLGEAKMLIPDWYCITFLDQFWVAPDISWIYFPAGTFWQFYWGNQESNRQFYRTPPFHPRIFGKPSKNPNNDGVQYWVYDDHPYYLKTWSLRQHKGKIVVVVLCRKRERER